MAGVASRRVWLESTAVIDEELGMFSVGKEGRDQHGQWSFQWKLKVIESNQLHQSLTVSFCFPVGLRVLAAETSFDFGLSAEPSGTGWGWGRRRPSWPV